MNTAAQQFERVAYHNQGFLDEESLGNNKKASRQINSRN